MSDAGLLALFEVSRTPNGEETTPLAVMAAAAAKALENWMLAIEVVEASVVSWLSGWLRIDWCFGWKKAVESGVFAYR